MSLQSLKVGILCTVVSGVFLCTCCYAQEGSVLNTMDTTNKPTIIGEEGGEYTFGVGDALEISVRNQPEFSGAFVVAPEGSIQYRFVGDVPVLGLTKEELKSKLESLLSAYVKEPEIGITILAYRSKFIYILGEVGRPGKYPMVGDSITLRDALVAAGLPTPDAALRRTYVIKPDTDKPVYKKVDLYKLLYLGILKQNIDITPGDLIVVPSTVPTEINRALTKMLSPITRAAVVEELLSDYIN